MWSSSSPAAAVCFGRENPLSSLRLQHSWGCVQGTDARGGAECDPQREAGEQEGKFWRGASWRSREFSGKLKEQDLEAGIKHRTKCV